MSKTFHRLETKFFIFHGWIRWEKSRFWWWWFLLSRQEPHKDGWKTLRRFVASVQIGKHGLFIEDKPTLDLLGVSSHKSWVHGGFSTALGVMLLSIELGFSSKATVTNGDVQKKHRFPCRGREISWIMVWMTRWWQLKYFYFHPYLGKYSNLTLTNIFQMGWNSTTKTRWFRSLLTWWISWYELIWTSQLWIHLSHFPVMKLARWDYRIMWKNVMRHFETKQVPISLPELINLDILVLFVYSVFQFIQYFGSSESVFRELSGTV